jgi:predicted secreted protein
MATSETKGIAIGLYVDVEDGSGSVVQTLVAARRGLSLEETLELFDASTADNRADGPARVPDMNDWSASIDGLLLFDEGTGSMDATQRRLQTAVREKEEVTVEVQYPGGYVDEGTAFVETFSLEAPHDDLSTYSADLSAASPLTEQ